MLNFDPNALTPFFTYVENTFSLPMPNIHGNIKANLNRVALLLQMSTGTGVAHPITDVSGFVGITVQSGGALLILKYADIGPIVGSEWFFASQAGGTIYVGEVIFIPNRGQE